MGVARLPAEKPESSSPPAEYLAGETLAEQLVGSDLHLIARRLYPGNTQKQAQKRRVFRRKITRLAATNKDFQQAIAENSKAQLILALPSVSRRLAQRTVRLGKPQEAKLVFEASGFHNPRVQHEHSGDVSITLNIPRPQLPEGDNPPEDVVDSTAEEITE